MVGRGLAGTGVGLLIGAEQMPALREKATAGVPREIHRFLLSEAAKRLKADVPIPPVPADGVMKMRGGPLPPDLFENTMPLFAYAYLMTGDERYAAAAWAILENLLAYDVWPSYNGEPHIRASAAVRSTAITYDWIYGYLSEAKRKYVRQRLIKVGLEPIIRFHTIGGRSMSGSLITNQSDHMLSSAILGALAVRPEYPPAQAWVRGLTEALACNLTNSMGPGGEYLQNALDGYWAISIDALVLAADALARAGEADLFRHPYMQGVPRFLQAHLTTTPPLSYKRGTGYIYDAGYTGPVAVSQQPVCTPLKLSPTLALLGLARNQHNQAALDLWQACYDSNVRTNARGLHNIKQIGAFHSTIPGPILSLLWYPPKMTAQPFELSKGRNGDYYGHGVAAIRTGFARGDTHLIFGGNLALAAKGEVLGSGIGFVRFNPWTNYAGTENQILTEDESIAPNMSLQESLAGEGFRFFHAVTSPTDNRYYRKPGEETAHQRYIQRDRGVLFLRPLVKNGSGQFVLLDRVEQSEQRYHTWQWIASHNDHAADWR